MSARRVAVLVVIAGLGGLIGARVAAADEIVVKGDRLRGTVVGVTATTVEFETPGCTSGTAGASTTISASSVTPSADASAKFTSRVTSIDTTIPRCDTVWYPMRRAIRVYVPGGTLRKKNRPLDAVNVVRPVPSMNTSVPSSAWPA